MSDLNEIPSVYVLILMGWAYGLDKSPLDEAVKIVSSLKPDYILWGGDPQQPDSFTEVLVRVDKQLPSTRFLACSVDQKGTKKYWDCEAQGYNGTIWKPYPFAQPVGNLDILEVKRDPATGVRLADVPPPRQPNARFTGLVLNTTKVELESQPESQSSQPEETNCPRDIPSEEKVKVHYTKFRALGAAAMDYLMHDLENVTKIDVLLVGGGPIAKDQLDDMRTYFNGHGGLIAHVGDRGPRPDVFVRARVLEAKRTNVRTGEEEITTDLPWTTLQQGK